MGQHHAGLLAQLVLLRLRHHANTIRNTRETLRIEILSWHRYADQFDVWTAGPCVRTCRLPLADDRSIYPRFGRGKRLDRVSFRSRIAPCPPPAFFFSFFFSPPPPNSTDPIGKDRKVFNISLVERFLIVRVYFLPLGMDYPYCRVLLCLAHTRCWPSGYRLMNVVEWEPSYTLVSSLVSTISFRFFRPCRVYHHGYKLLGSSGKTNLPPSPISLLHLLLFHFLTYSLLLILLLLLLIHSRVN